MASPFCPPMFRLLTPLVKNEPACFPVVMTPQSITLAIPDWKSHVDRRFSPPPPVEQPQANDEDFNNFDSSDTEAQNSEGNIGTDLVSGERGFNCDRCGSFIRCNSFDPFRTPCNCK
jgi:hypothetical protein